MASSSSPSSSESRPPEVSFIVAEAEATTDIPRGIGGSKGRSGDFEHAVANTTMATAKMMSRCTDINPVEGRVSRYSKLCYKILNSRKPSRGHGAFRHV